MHRFFTIVLQLFMLLSSCAVYSKTFVVNVPVIDLFGQPTERDEVVSEADFPILFARNGHQLSQVLYGEKVTEVKTIKRRSGWVCVDTQEEIYYDAGRSFIKLRGWVKSTHLVAPTVHTYPDTEVVVAQPWATLRSKDGKDLLSVSIGTKLLGVRKRNSRWKIRLVGGGFGYVDEAAVHETSMKKSACEQRDAVCDMTKIFLATPASGYLWGGRTLFNKNCGSQWTGIDCSNAVRLIYDVALGFDLPRNSKSQYIRSTKLETISELNKGDLVFLSRRAVGSDDWSIYHVMIYMGQDDEGNDLLFEASGLLPDRGGIRIITALDRIGCQIAGLKAGSKTREGYVYFGSCF